MLVLALTFLLLVTSGSSIDGFVVRPSFSQSLRVRLRESVTGASSQRRHGRVSLASANTTFAEVCNLRASDLPLVIGLQSKETALLPFGNCTLLTGLVSGVDIPVYLRTQSSSTRILVANISSLCDDGHFNTFFITSSSANTLDGIDIKGPRASATPCVASSSSYRLFVLNYVQNLTTALEPEIRYGPSLPYGLFGDAAQFGEGDVQDLQQPVDHVRFVRADSMAVFAVAPAMPVVAQATSVYAVAYGVNGSVAFPARMQFFSLQVAQPSSAPSPAPTVSPTNTPSAQSVGSKFVANPQLFIVMAIALLALC